jgi:hypothetical protein
MDDLAARLAATPFEQPAPIRQLLLPLPAESFLGGSVDKKKRVSIHRTLYFYSISLLAGFPRSETVIKSDCYPCILQ